MSAPLSFTTTTTFTLPEHLVLLTRAEAALMLRVHVLTLDRHIAAGLLPVVRIGSRVLLRRSALSAYLGPAEHAAALLAHTPVDPAAVLTFAEAHDLMRVSAGTLTRLTNAGMIPVALVGHRRRVRLVDLAEFIDMQSEAATDGTLAGRSA